MVTLAQLTLNIWAEVSNEHPTAAAMACFFRKEEEWQRAVDDHWHQCTLGLDRDASLTSCATVLWKTLRRMRDSTRESRNRNILSQLSIDNSINRLRFAQLTAVASLKRVQPRETRTPRGLRLPGQSAKHRPKPAINGLTSGEAELLAISAEAGDLSGHHELIQHQASSGYSEFFPETWKNLLGNIKQSAVHALLHSWKRWRRYVKETSSQWHPEGMRVTLFAPTAGCLAHYAGVRSMGGVTAARGAMTCLWRFVTVTKLTFPFQESGVNGWNVRLRDHVVQARIPFEVAQLAHFDYHAKFNRNPFVLVVCCAVWFSFLGMCRDAHIQRSKLTKHCKHAWMFHCIAGKDRSKPFDWVIPEANISGSATSHKLMTVVRGVNPSLVAPDEGEPWLLPQWYPNTTDPITGVGWRNKPISPTQMKMSKARLCQEHPLNSSFLMDAASYASRRAGPGVLGLVSAKGHIRNAFGNWKEAELVKQERSNMPDNYTEQQLIISFEAKYLVAEVIRRTIQNEGTVNFQWGEVSKMAPHVEHILAEAGPLAADIRLPRRESEYMQRGMMVDLDISTYLDSLPQQVPPGGEDPVMGDQVIKPALVEKQDEDEYDPTVPLADDESVSSADSSSDSDVEKEWHSEEMEAYARRKLVAGKTKTAYIHIIKDADRDTNLRVATLCGASPWRKSADSDSVGNAKAFAALVKKPFCKTCLEKWPIDMVKQVMGLG